MQEEPIRVLLVEDNEADYLLIRDLLAAIEGTRFQLDRAATYSAAQEAIRRNTHSVYLLASCVGDWNCCGKR